MTRDRLATQHRPVHHRVRTLLEGHYPRQSQGHAILGLHARPASPEGGGAMILTTPTLDKIKEVHEQSEAIGSFLEWGEEHRLFMCRYNPRTGDYDAAGTIDDLLHLYFGIDAEEEEREKRAVLGYIREQHKAASQ